MNSSADYRKGWFHRYPLEPSALASAGHSQPAKARVGALLKLEFSAEELGISGKGSRFGYADCHPWVELGDDSLAKQLQRLASRDLSPLLQQSVLCASNDAIARSQGRSFWESLTVPKSHYSAPWLLGEVNCQAIAGLGFGTVKIKVSGSQDAEGTGKKLHQLLEECNLHNLKLRVDFNESGTIALMEQLFQNADVSHLDWIEDPIPFDPEGFAHLSRSLDLSVALDRVPPTQEASLNSLKLKARILKPAVDGISRAGVSNAPKCYTSYLDHPIGQLWAAYVAANDSATPPDHPGQVDGGLCSHTAYVTNEFSERLTIQNGVLIPPSGTGLGFDDLLENLTWEELI